MERRQFLKKAGIVALTLPVYADLFGGLPAFAAKIAARAPAAPQFSAPVKAFLGEIVDVIIPPTDTPGARAAGVVAFIEAKSFNWLSPEEYQQFMAHTAALDRGVKQKFGKPFGMLTATEKLGHLKALDAASVMPPSGGKIPYFKLLKQFTLFGYYTSKAGGAAELTYNPMPGYYDPCDKVEADDHAPDMYWVNMYMRVAHS